MERNLTREHILYQGDYTFGDAHFSKTLLKNIGILEKITSERLLEATGVCHAPALLQLGFEAVEPNIWVKNIFLFALRPPQFPTDRGKCLILKKPHVKKLTKTDRPANVVYKGRYIFNDGAFTQTLFQKIGLLRFEEGEQNKDYTFVRETFAGSTKFIEEALLNF